MKILSIDACTETISIALIVEKVITEKNFPSGKNYSGNILPEGTEYAAANDEKHTATTASRRDLTAQCANTFPM